MRRSTNIRRALHRAQLGKLLGAWLWTWMKLTEQLNFCGCELLIVDAEGHDTAVLCSMLAHCKERLRNGLYEWPNVIQFETMGHCNKKEVFGAEWGIITAVEAEDYALYLYIAAITIAAWRGQRKSEDCLMRAALMCSLQTSTAPPPESQKLF